jgi:sensor histidine kinase regulating citrate/malate metabolism
MGKISLDLTKCSISTLTQKGLILMKAQVEGMGGTISVESTVDIGTKFKIIF